MILGTQGVKEKSTWNGQRLENGLSCEASNNTTLFLFVDWLTSKQHASAFQGQGHSDKFTCCHIEIEVADQTFYLTQSQ